ncbi:MAG: hypothetical protein DRP60_11940 [Spirochaetes bacterium]|nr:MAG: hypothetical protein DRP60_11940 [Spirochaetota bacterium]
MRISAVLSLVIAGLLTSCADRVEVYYSSNLNGNLLGCDCRGYPEAGLDKRAWYLDQNPLPEDALLLDAGNILDTGRDPVLTGFILKTYEELGYQAVAVGTNELADGPGALMKRVKDGSFISHNIVSESEGTPLTAMPLILETKTGVKVAVISLADPDWFNPWLARFNGALSIIDPAAVLEKQQKMAAEDGAAAIVLLANGSEGWIRGLMANQEVNNLQNSHSAMTPVTAVILAGEEKLIEENLPGGIPLLSPGEEGNRLGILNLKLHGSRKPGWKNEFIEFHYLGLGDETVAARGAEYAEYLDSRR